MGVCARFDPLTVVLYISINRDIRHRNHDKNKTEMLPVKGRRSLDSLPIFLILKGTLNTLNILQTDCL